MRPFYFLSFLIFSTILLSQNPGNSLLWRISKNQSSKFSYLYGTMHVKDKRIFYANDSLPAFISSCDKFALELHPDSMNTMLFNQLNSADTASNNFKKIFNEEEYRLVNEKLQKDIGIDLTQVKNKDLNYIRMLISPTKKRSDDYATFLDGYLLKIAKRTDRSIIGLESIKSQASAFRSIKSTTEFKDEILEMSREEKSESVYDKMLKLYQAENMEGIHQIFTNYDEESINNMLYRRNVVMARTIDSIISGGGSIFAACGAGHLGGAKGIIKLLKDLGYSVTAVQTKKRSYLNANKIPSTTGTGWQKIALPSVGVNYVLPGAPMAYKKNIILAESKMYMDVTSGAVYMMLPVSITSDLVGNKRFLFDKVAESMQQRMAKGISLDKKYGKQGAYEYCEVSFETKVGYSLVSRIYIENNVLYDFLVTYPPNSDIEKEAEYFFSAINFYKPIAQETYLYKDENWNFEISLPGEPAKVNTARKKGAASELSLKSSDNINGVHYIIEGAEAGEGLYYISDTMLLNEVCRKFKHQPRVISYTDSVFTFQGFPAKQFVAVFDDNSTCEGWLILKGFKFYSIMAVATKKNIDAGIHKAILNSFTFRDVKTPEYKWYKSPVDSLLTIKLPKAYRIKASDAEENQYNEDYSPIYTSYEDGYGVSCFMQRTEETDYYYTLSDSLYWKRVEQSLVGYSDSLILSEKLNLKGLNARRYIVKKLNSSYTEYYNVISFGKYRYSIFSYIPDVLKSSYLTTPIYNLEYKGTPKTVFQSDTVAFKNLVRDYLSTDTILNKKARKYIYEFDATDNMFPLLVKELERPAKDSTSDLKDRLINKLDDVKPALLTPYLKKKLFTDRTDSTFDVNYLRMLVGIKTQESFSYIKSFLAGRLSTLSEYSGIFYGMNDSLVLAKVFYPDFLEAIAKDTSENSSFLYLTNNMLDSSYVKYEQIKDFENSLLKYASRYIDQKVSDKELMEHYVSVEVFDLLFKSDNKKMLSELLVKMAQSKNIWIRYYSIVYALKNKSEPDLKVMNELVRTPYLRHSIYAELEFNKRLELFPAAFKNQKALAEGDMINYMLDDDYYPKEVKFVKEIKTRFEEKDVYFFIFKLEFNEGTAPVIGFTGPYTKNGELLNNSERPGIGGDYVKGQEEILLYEHLYQK